MMLGALWAVVRNWHEKGMPKGSVVLPSFECYSGLLGGIVEAAGYAPPFAKAVLPDAKSPGAAEFDELLTFVLEEMGLEPEKDFSLQDLARLARAGQLYQKAVGTQEDGKKLSIKQDGLGKDERGMAVDHGYMDASQNSSFGKMITKQIGTEHKILGKRVQFGKRAQSRKATYTVTVME